MVDFVRKSDGSLDRRYGPRPARRPPRRQPPPVNIQTKSLPLPDAPTMALPGSEEKMQVMADRLQSRRHLHHPLDTKLDTRVTLSVLEFKKLIVEIGL